MNARALIAPQPDDSPWAIVSQTHLEALWLVASCAVLILDALQGKLSHLDERKAVEALCAALDALDASARGTGPAPAVEHAEAELLHRCADAAKCLVRQALAVCRARSKGERRRWQGRTDPTLAELGAVLAALGLLPPDG